MTHSSSTSSVIKHAEQHCQQRGSRLTEKRRYVLTGLVQSQKALSAYELTDYCRDQLGQQLPAMSVYRILELLEGEYLVHGLHLPKKYVACSHITCSHDHEIPQFLICNGCSAVEEISIKKNVIQSLKKSVVEAGYHLASPQLEFECYCSDCGPASE